MHNLIERLIGSSRRHVGDDELLALKDGELSRTQARRVEKHLERCWNCRARQSQLQAVIHGFVNYSNEVVAPFLPPPPSGRDRFLAAIEVELKTQPRSLRTYATKTVRTLLERAMNPVFLTVVVVVVACFLIAIVWTKMSGRKAVPEQLLTRIVAAERSKEHQSGVAYQRVEIRSNLHTMERLIYRDLAGRRTQRKQRLSLSESRLKERLDSAGVDWQNPLSAADYEAWHRRVSILQDRVRETAPGELTITAESSDSRVREASLTVRESDFHPVGREVIFRDSEEVQLSELTYSVLPWTDVNASIFESSPVEAIHSSGSGAVPVLHGVFPTLDRLVAAELQAQLALVQLHATNGEDIRVDRGNVSIDVRGIVDSDDRKQEIETALRRIALVTPEIQSFEQIERQHRASQTSTSVQVKSGGVASSPLQNLVSAGMISQEHAIDLSRSLTQASITIDREARTLERIADRYNAGTTALTGDNQALFESLKQAHLAALLQAVASEEVALAPYAQSGDFHETGEPQALSILAALNQNLCAELLSDNQTTNRSAKALLGDLVRVSAQIRSTASKQ